MKSSVSTQILGIGLAAICGAVFLGSVADASAKWFGDQGYLPTQVVFLRYVFGLIPVAFFLAHSGLGALRTNRLKEHFLRACLGFGSIVFFFWGITLMPLAEAIAISFTAPLFITALSIPMLGERVGPRRWAAVIVGFIGALIVVQPGTDTFRPGAIIITISCIGYALSMIMTRRMSGTESNVALFTYTTIMAGFISAPFLAHGWLTPSLPHWGLFSGFGVIEGCASFLLIIAYRNAPAAVIAPFDYTAMIWASLFGWILWSENPGSHVWLGAGIIALSGVYIARREALSKMHKKSQA